MIAVPVLDKPALRQTTLADSSLHPSPQIVPKMDKELLVMRTRPSAGRGGKRARRKPDISMGWHGCLIIPVTITILQCIVVRTQTSVFDIACDFETNLCGWTHENLSRTEFPSILSDRSGPRHAQSGNFYVYLDTSSKGVGDDYTATLDTGNITVPASTNSLCLRFWYHMFGETMGDLNVLVDNNVVWKKSGNQSDVWHCAAVDITSLRFKISFEAVMGYDIYSIIALDNIQVLHTECLQENCENLHLSTTEVPKYTSLSTTLPTTSGQSVVSATTATTKIDLNEYIPYIIGVPAAILVVGAIILIVCLRNKKLTKRPDPMIVPPEVRNRYDVFPHDPYDTVNDTTVEEYDYLDETKMVRQDSLNVPNGEANNPYNEPDITPSAGHNGDKDYDYEQPIRRNEQDYLNPTSEQLDNNYITPINHTDAPRRMSSDTTSSGQVDMSMRPASDTSVPEVDHFDYVVVTPGKREN
ncbi:uncharacterized protein LOC132557661 [Ylistrum balloti]|uniref:uncharacterized protein LOC132557661 n=1 Tax=Ylistrum balloti TaxID=509963 RepID=UPI0029059273|nr:uncharacterized protein LOC132557661 [Ylistrum balloti]